jgi:hypothetical protein
LRNKKSSYLNEPNASYRVYTFNFGLLAIVLKKEPGIIEMVNGNVVRHLGITEHKKIITK